jgi:uncharacterized protein with PQ loop repeat
MLNTKHVTHKTKPSKKDTRFDRVVLVVSILYPLSALPQLISIFEGNIAGVSVYSWAGFLMCASLFLIYGLRHKVWPMILSNTLWVMVDSLVVIAMLQHYF